MADITVTTDVSQINNLKEALKSLDPVFVKIVDGIVRENNRLQRLLKKSAKDTEENNKILAQAQEAYSTKLEQESAKREKARAREAAQAEKEAKRIAAAIEKKAAAEARAAQVQAGNRADTAFALGKQRYEEEARALEELNRAKQAAASREDVLRQKYDESYRAMVIYRTQIQELNEALSVGVLTQAGYKDRIDQLNQSLADGSIVAGAYTNQASDGMNKFGVAAQQTGYQVSDFIVQIQSGTNPLVAFSQQATQLAGLLYLLPQSMQAARIGIGAFSVSMATATAGLTIVIPLLAMLAMSFFNSEEKAKGAGKGINDLESQLKSLDQSLADYVATRDALAQGLTLDQVISGKGLVQAQQDLEDYKASLGTLRKGMIDALLGGFGLGEDVTATLEALNAEIESAEERQLKIRQRILDAYQEETIALQENFELEIGKIRLGEKSVAYKELEAKAERRAYQSGLDRQGLDDAHIVALMEQYDQIVKNRTEAEKASKQAESLRDRALEALGHMKAMATTDLSSAFAKAMPAAQNFLDKLREMASAYATYGPGNVIPGTAIPYGKFTEGGMDVAARGQMLNRPNPFGTLAGGAAGVFTATGTGGGGAAQEDALAKLREQLILENELLGVSEAQKRVMQALGDQRSKYSEAEINAITAEVEAYNLKLEALKQQEQLAKTMQSSMETAFMSIVSGTESAKDAFKKMAYEVVKELYKVLVVQRMVGQFQSGGGGILGSLAGLFGKRASGGSIMPGQSYMVGENGPELVIPRHSGTVVNANQTASAGGNGGGFTQNLTISVTGSDAAMVRAEVGKMIPQITNATKAAVIDARLRGGQMAAAFR